MGWPDSPNAIEYSSGPKTPQPGPDLNRFMANSPILFDSHMHTPLCKHAYGEPSEYAAHGYRNGLKGIIFTCHSPMPNRWSYAVRMSPDDFETYVQMVHEAAALAPDDFEVRLGMESDFFPGMENWLTELHNSAEFHYILGSVHWHVPEYRDAYWKGDIHKFQVQYFEHLAESAETGLFDCLAHPDLIKNANPVSYNLRTLRPHIERALDRIAATGVAMELNTSGLHKTFPEYNPGPDLLRLMSERGIPVVLGSDSHNPERVGESFVDALDELEAAGFTSVHVFEHRQPTALGIDEVRESLGLALMD